MLRARPLRPWLLAAAILTIVRPSWPIRADGPPAPPADQAVGILRTHCYRCHGQEFKVEGYDVLDRIGLLAKRGEKSPYITPGKPDESELWNRFDDMPPKGPRPTSRERETIRKWIESGAPFPATTARRAFLPSAAVLSAIRDHLKGRDRADRPSWRYFTLTNLHNNPKVTEEELKLARAGISKMINSLSRKPEIVVPEVIGPGGSALAVDIRRLGWDNARVWSRILAAYPYGLRFRDDRDPSLRELALEIEDLIGPDAGLPDVRADWFLDAAARPDLYHDILGIPPTVAELERSLGVDVESDFRGNTLRRAGFTRSGVSKQMRMVDRHDSQLGYYWKSYDFRRTDKAVNLFRFPLGPAFAGHPFPDEAFTHAGGEMIFSLPNRLQGYMLATNAGQRIGEGPPDIVFDANDSAGGSVIINGMSCMGCHRNGMIEFKDRIREGVGVSEAARRKVEQLFPAPAEMDRLVKQDQARFLAALEQAIGPFLREPGSKATTRDLKEPVIPVAKIYQADMDLEAVAAELNLKEGETLRALIRSNRRLERLGMGDLLKDGGALNRAEWGTAGRGTSAFQKAASELGLGTPAVFLRRED
ncbi:c-type cytochrome domain-containing protein [Aquisphaera insulae]|uniref:c-type cytochrome domain-containing protein n=1 Tax=Aquisphaera insulae TaxID=2712864 RepID=UPI0013EA5D4E|nr:c-type cytochrome domain-containing protein [Aquisphaera insulae]